MDSPQLLHLALLLLALAAPRPNSATSIIGTTEWIEDYYTEVSVYRCKDCNSCTCKPGANNFEKFEIIADTQKEIFSEEIIELVTDKTHITVCFEEPNSCLERIYGIFWQKPEGSGRSCVILRFGENGRGGVSTEQKMICCEAETDTRKYSPELKCFYTLKSHPKLTSSAAGNPEFPAGKSVHIGMSIGIPLAVVVLVVCIVAIYWLQRRDQGCRHCRQAPSRENTPVPERPSTNEETPLSAPSSSLSE